MPQIIVVKGRLVSPTTVELDSPVEMPRDSDNVEVILPATPLDERSRREKTKKLIEHLMSLPPGTRTKEDINRQIQEERDTWE
jgi:hypothetical protein